MERLALDGCVGVAVRMDGFNNTRLHAIEFQQKDFQEVMGWSNAPMRAGTTTHERAEEHSYLKVAKLKIHNDFLKSTDQPFDREKRKGAHGEKC